MDAALHLPRMLQPPTKDLPTDGPCYLPLQVTQLFQEHWGDRRTSILPRKNHSLVKPMGVGHLHDRRVEPRTQTATPHVSRWRKWGSICTKPWSTVCKLIRLIF